MGGLVSGLIGGLIGTVRNVFRRREIDRDLDEEVRAYLDLATQQKIDAGMDPAAAARAARLELGGVGQVVQEVRAARAGAWLEEAVRDLRHAMRMLLRAPGFTAVAVLTLALGIGANTAIFSVVDGVLFQEVPFAQPDDLVVVWETDRNSGTSREPASLPDFVDFQRRAGSVSSLAAFMAGEANLAGVDAEPRRVAALAVTHELLPTLGVAPLLGRGFTAAETRPNGPKVAVISESLWADAYQRSPDVLGRIIRLDDEAYVVIGVVPERAGFGVLQILSGAAYSRAFADRGARGEVDVWAPLQEGPDQLPRSTHPLFLVGRLAPGRTAAAAQQELAGIAADLERAYPENDARGVFVEPLEEVVFAPVRPALMVLLGTVLLVLLIASVNVANLLLARGATRAREIAVRTALGATGGRLTRQFLVENVLLALIAAGAGLGLAFAGLEVLLAIAPPDVPRLGEVGVDTRVLLFTLAVSIAVGLVFGMVPALQARRVEVQSTLKGEGGRATAGRARRRLRAALVVGELALAVLLVAGASLLVRSFWRLRDVDPGFRADGVLKAEMQLPRTRYPVDFQRWPDLPEIHAFTAALLERASALPGVESVGRGRQPPARPGLHQLVRRRRTRGGGRVVARDLDPARDPGLLPHRRAAAGARAPAADLRRHRRRAGAAGQPRRGRSLLRRARGGRPADPAVGDRAPHGRRGRQRAPERPGRRRAARCLSAACPGAVGQRRPRAAPAHARRSGGAGPGGAPHGPRARTSDIPVRRRAARPDPGPLGLAAPLRHAAPGPVRRPGPGPGRHRRVRRAGLRRGAEDARDRHPPGAGRAAALGAAAGGRPGPAAGRRRRRCSASLAPRRWRGCSRACCSPSSRPTRSRSCSWRSSCWSSRWAPATCRPARRPGSIR